MSNKFNEFFSLHGVHHSNHYKIEMDYPTLIQTKNRVSEKEFSELVSHYCIAVDLPSVAVVSNSFRTYGEPFDLPTGKTYETFNLRFYSDAQCNLYKMFTDWVEYIYDPKTRTVAFRSDYGNTTAKVSMCDVNLRPTRTVVFENVWPKSVSSVVLSGENGNTATSFNVVMQFRRSYVE